ncbi:primosomal protein DnaI [Sporosarcina gallistercoris]|uniref:Primosomal protein DnaI n=1 Tax=Sporosarcina gallistercoris TaxID=2762245 RepID=A0ABR8PIF8_9BACL|nr:primosomal protein DnaI [Sporosarcina gallistercoris]MBD7907955.1 primosomal protein DnaI [Sporosarcina gallistercoris]
MERIGEAMKRVINAPTLAARYDELRNEVLANEKIQQFIEEHADEIDKQVVEKSLNKLYEFTTASHQCDKCPNLGGCINVMKGFEPKLTLNQGVIDVSYIRCPSKELDDEKRAVNKMLNSLYMPKDVMKAQLIDVDTYYDNSRLDIVEKASEFISQYVETGVPPEKGLYIHGEFGTGKSFILGALANELASRQIRTVIVYLPEFLREIKQSIQDNSLNEKIEFVKKAAVLMIDDIGAESMTAWARDEVLGTILQYRMADQLPTFFTSNFTLSELEHHLTFSQRGEKEPIKAARIMERIKIMSDPVLLSGKNRRNPGKD